MTTERVSLDSLQAFFLVIIVIFLFIHNLTGVLWSISFLCSLTHTIFITLSLFTVLRLFSLIAVVRYIARKGRFFFFLLFVPFVLFVCFLFCFCFFCLFCFDFCWVFFCFCFWGLFFCVFSKSLTNRDAIKSYKSHEGEHQWQWQSSLRHENVFNKNTGSLNKKIRLRSTCSINKKKKKENWDIF